MDSNDRIKELVENPTESLTVELKRWIDPDTQKGQAKIVKAALAIRNHGGGEILIGFNDKTLKPDTTNIPENVREKFHIDKIQGLISRYTSDLFEVSIKFVELEGQEYPVIIIPTGIKTPIFSKNDLKAEGGNFLIKKNIYYVRSLLANGTPSSVEAKGDDLRNIMEICFNNREADIGRFLRRHLSELNLEIIREFVKQNIVEPEQKIEESLSEFLQESYARFKAEAKNRNTAIPKCGFLEIGMHVIGNIPTYSANQDFLNLLDRNNPSYTGWPIWLIIGGSGNKDSHPYVKDATWEAFIQVTGIAGIDFMRMDPKGKFYLLRTLRDDFNEVVNPLTCLEPFITTIRTAEAIAVGISFAKAMGCDQQNTSLAFMFKWSKLKNRMLKFWANPQRFIRSYEPAVQDEIQMFVNVPLETPLSAIGEYVYQAVKPLFELFGGFVFPQETIEDWTQKLIDRKL